MSGKATLVGFSRGFGGDNYDFEIHPNIEIRPGVTTSRITIACGWGLLAPDHLYRVMETHTNVEITRGIDADSLKSMARPIEVLRKLGYEFISSIDGDLHIIQEEQ